MVFKKSLVVLKFRSDWLFTIYLTTPNLPKKPRISSDQPDDNSKMATGKRFFHSNITVGNFELPFPIDYSKVV